MGIKALEGRKLLSRMRRTGSDESVTTLRLPLPLQITLKRLEQPESPFHTPSDDDRTIMSTSVPGGSASHKRLHSNKDKIRSFCELFFSCGGVKSTLTYKKKENMTGNLTESHLATFLLL